MAFERCPVCGGDLVLKEVQKILRGGANTAVLKVCAEVCLRCKERLYSEEIRADTRPSWSTGKPRSSGLSEYHTRWRSFRERSIDHSAAVPAARFGSCAPEVRLLLVG